MGLGMRLNPSLRRPREPPATPRQELPSGNAEWPRFSTLCRLPTRLTLLDMAHVMRSINVLRSVWARPQQRKAPGYSLAQRITAKKSFSLDACNIPVFDGQLKLWRYFAEHFSGYPLEPLHIGGGQSRREKVPGLFM